MSKDKLYTSLILKDGKRKFLRKGTNMICQPVHQGVRF